MITRWFSNRVAMLAALLTFAIACGAAGNPALGDGVSPVGPKLTPKLKRLIKTEMSEITASTQEITKAIATGDHATVAAEAVKIANGFILKRSLTDRDKKDLKRAAPLAFLMLDAAFHLTAEKLARAAAKKDTDLVGFYLSKMLGYCVTCHSTFAANRFGGFVK